jgi:hypothetical protein
MARNAWQPPGGSGGGITSVNGQTGPAVTLTAASVGADPAGAAAAAQAASDPAGSAAAAQAASDPAGSAAAAQAAATSGQALPSDFGYLAWTFDPGYCNSAGGPPSSFLSLVKFTLRAAATISTITSHVVTVPAGTLTAGENFAGIYDSGGTLRGATADTTASWGTNGIKANALVTPYTAPAGTYYVAFLVNVTGGAGPIFRASVATASTFLMNAGLSGAGLRIATQAATAALPGTLAYSSNAQTSASAISALLT